MTEIRKIKKWIPNEIIWWAGDRDSAGNYLLNMPLEIQESLTVADKPNWNDILRVIQALVKETKQE